MSVREFPPPAGHKVYARIVAEWDERVAADPCRETYTDRWCARLKHPSWEEKRQAFLWYTDSRCERCGGVHREDELQLHHLHYASLWYENNGDLQLLCMPCHRIADEERAQAELARRGPTLTVEQRIRAYMEVANRFSGQPDWPVTYKEASEKVLGWDNS